MAASFVPRAIFPILDSLPRSYYLGHHAAGLSKMRTLLNQTDLIIECRDYRIPLTSRNPLFEDMLGEKERIVVYTKKDLGSSGVGDGDRKTYKLLQTFHQPSQICISDFRSQSDIRRILRLVRDRSIAQNQLTGSHCMVVGMPNVGKSTLLNALRSLGVHGGKAAHTGAQPGVTRKIGTGVKIIEPSDTDAGVYLLDTPGVFIPYVPNASSMLKLALCGSVKDTVIPAFTLADYLLFHINHHDAGVYATYHPPTNDITTLLQAMARKIGRLQKGGEPDLDGTAMWMVQRWRNGHLGRFRLDEVSEEAFVKYREGETTGSGSLSQARKSSKDSLRARSKARKRSEAG